MRARFFLAVGFSASYLPAITHASCPNPANSPALINPPEASRSYSSIDYPYDQSRIDSKMAWMAKGSPSGQDDHWMIIDMGSDLSIAGFAVQASAANNGFQWINSFNAESWKDGGSPETLFDANFDIAFTNYPKLHSGGQYAEVFFKESVVARYFKISVVSFENSPAMRVGALQCTIEATEAAPSPQTTQPPNPQTCPNPVLINPPETNRSFSSRNLRFGMYGNSMSWIDSPWGWFPMYSPNTAAATPGVSPGEVYKDESMIIDMLSDMSIAGFAIQAGITAPLDGKVRWVNSFTAEYRKNGESELTSVDNGDVFENYPNLLAKGKYATVFFKKSVVARYFKLHVKTFEGEIPAIRVGLLKCPVQTTQPPSPQTTRPPNPQTTRPPNPQTTRPPSSQTTRPESCPIQSVVSTDNTITFSPLNMQDGKVWLDFEFETGSMYCVQFNSAGEVNVKKCYLNDVTTGASVTGASVTTQPPPPAPKACVCENGFSASPHDPLCLVNNFPQCVDKGCKPGFSMKYGLDITINGKTALETFCLAEAKACQKGEYVGSKCCTCPNGVPAERESADCNADGDQKCMGCDQGYFMFPTGPFTNGVSFTNECRLIQVV